MGYLNVEFKRELDIEKAGDDANKLILLGSALKQEYSRLLIAKLSRNT